MMQTYAMTMAAGGQWTSDVSGRYFRVIAASGPIDVNFFRRGNQKGTASGVGVGFWAKPTESFDKISIRSATAQTVTFLVGAGEAGYDMVSVTGQVQVIDGEAERVAAGKVFGAQMLLLNVAGQYGQSAVICAANKRVTVKKIIMWSGTAGSMVMGVITPANLASANYNTNNGLGYGLSMLGGGAGSASTVKGPAGLAAASTPGYTNGFSPMVQASQSIQIEFPRPFVLPAGYAFGVSMLTQNVSGQAYVEFIEDAA